jgi:hypothetical protein
MKKRPPQLEVGLECSRKADEPVLMLVRLEGLARESWPVSRAVCVFNSRPKMETQPVKPRRARLSTLLLLRTVAATLELGDPGEPPRRGNGQAHSPGGNGPGRRERHTCRRKDALSNVIQSRILRFHPPRKADVPPSAGISELLYLSQ